MNTPDILTVTGLTLDEIGIVLLFVYAPEKFPDPQSTASFSIEDGSRDNWRKEQPRRHRIARLSVFTIVVGFALQAIAVIIW